MADEETKIIPDFKPSFFSVDSNDGLNLIRTLMFPDGSARSQQLTASDNKARLGDALFHDLLYPDYDPTFWAKTPEMSTRVHTGCRVIAQNVGGLRWVLNPTVNESKLSDEQKEEFERQKLIIEPLLTRPNPRWPLSTILYRVWYDKKATGKGHVEATRKGNGIIDGLYHAQSKNIYPLRSDTPSWVQKKYTDTYTSTVTAGSTAEQQKYFKEFGDEVVVDADSGKVWEGNGALTISKRATELLTFIEYSSDLEKIGAPPHASCAMAISGNYYTALRNRNTQITDAMPRAVITVSGGTLSDESEKSIHRFLNAGARNTDDMRSNRVMVLSVQKGSPTSNVSPDIKVIPLTVASGEDATFLKYRAANDDEVREAFGLAALYYGSSEGTNRASASVARHITIEQVFKPETEELEYVINNSIIRDLLGHHGIAPEDILLQFKMVRPPATDEVEQSQVISRYIQGGAFSPNDIRRYLNSQGFDLPLWEGSWAELPLFVILAMLKSMWPSDIGIETEGEPTTPTEQTTEATTVPQLTNTLLTEIMRDVKTVSADLMPPIP